AADDCGDLPVTVTCGVGTDPSDGHFHGLIGVTGQDWVLDLASHAGNTAGCGDCVWTIELDCPQSSPTQPDPADCAGMQGGAGCPPDAMPFRLYLTTSSVTNEVVGRICLGGGRQVVLVGEDAAADVDRYVHAVAPPDLLVQHRPRGATLAGLPTFFTARVPAGTVGPVGFGGPTVTEAITLVPEQAVWEWGDGDTSDWMPVDATAVHRYLSSGAVAGTLTTRWGATYTATFEGRTVGPFRADGELERPQPFVERVRVSAPILVSRQADALPSG
ncbi:MAG TPA: hypothetical protein VHE57_11950, partial [Mycobacteriales bacterium]|nr:hypothetical protein [Mycobacteriales bacterium]